MVSVSIIEQVAKFSICKKNPLKHHLFGSVRLLFINYHQKKDFSDIIREMFVPIAWLSKPTFILFSDPKIEKVETGR